MDDLLMRLAQGQHGLLTTSQAAERGWDRVALSAAVKSGNLVHLGRALYAVPSPDLEQREERHRALCRGALMLYPDAILSHASAVICHGLPVFGLTLTRAFLVRPVGREVLTQSFVIRAHRGAFGVDAPLGPTVEPALAIIQHTLDNGVAAGTVAADAALHRELVDRFALERAAVSVRGWPRSGRVATLMHMADGRSESVGESRLRLDLAMAGIPVVPQVVVRDANGSFVARVDLLVEGSKVVIEFDGVVKYRDEGAVALMAEKRREDALRRLGYIVVRVTWADLAWPARTVRWVREAIDTANGSRAAAS